MSKAKVKSIGQKFNLRALSFREFEVFLISLIHEGKQLNVLKHYVDLEFNHQSRTKGYDYINSLSAKGFIEKHSTNERGKKIAKIYVNKEVRDSYEKFIAPTLKDKKTAYKEFLKDNLDQINNLEKFKLRLSNCTDKINKSIQDLISKTPVEDLKGNKFKNNISKIIQRVKNEELLIGAYQIIPEKN
jgi:hypothetical protein